MSWEGRAQYCEYCRALRCWLEKLAGTDGFGVSRSKDCQASVQKLAHAHGDVVVMKDAGHLV
jgi:hypothetical protein